MQCVQEKRRQKTTRSCEKEEVCIPIGKKDMSTADGYCREKMLKEEESLKSFQLAIVQQEQPSRKQNNK